MLCFTRGYRLVSPKYPKPLKVEKALPFLEYKEGKGLWFYKPTVPLSAYTFGENKRADETKPPVLMLHGLFGSKVDFHQVAPKLTKKTRSSVYGVDLRNHGSSPRASDHTYMRMAEDVIKLLKEKEWPGEEKPILCGHGMGAKTAMLVALLEPDQISKLIVIDDAPVSQPLDDHFHKQLLALCHIESNARRLYLMGPRQRDANLDKILHEYGFEDRVIQFLKTAIGPVGRSYRRDILVKIPVLSFMDNKVLAKLGEWPEEVDRMKFEKPTLILKANGLDCIKSQDQFTANFPDNTYKSYDCSHWLVADEPKKFVSDVSQFITGVVPKTNS